MDDLPPQSPPSQAEDPPLAPPLPRVERRTGLSRRRPYWVVRLEHFLTIKRKLFPMWQGVAFVIFVALIFVPPFLSEPPEQGSPLVHFTLLANYVMWGLWFPLVLLSVLLTGRSWCGLFCPQGAASEWATRVGLKRDPPRWIRWEGTPIVSFILITILGQTLGVRDHPEAILELFGGTLFGAIIVGFLYGTRQRVWCRHMCPIGLLLGVFSRLGAVYFEYSKQRPGGDRYCTRCLCPTMVDIRYKSESRHCITCFRCVTPGARNGVLLRMHRPGREVENIHQHHANLPEVLFLFLSTGIALGAFLWLVLPHFQEFRQWVGMWFFEREMFWAGDHGPIWLMSVHPQRAEVFSWIDFFSIVSFMVTFMAFLTVLLSATTGMAAWLSVTLSKGGRIGENFIQLGYQYAPVAIISLLLGLGGELFKILGWMGLDANAIGVIKLGIFYFALVWSIFIGERILANQKVPFKWRWLPLLPGIAGSLLIGAAWKTALF